MGTDPNAWSRSAGSIALGIALWGAAAWAAKAPTAGGGRADTLTIIVPEKSYRALRDLAPDAVFFTSRRNPLRSLSAIGSTRAEVGVWGLELFAGMNEALRAAGVEPQGMSAVGDAHFAALFTARDSLRLFATHAYADKRQEAIVSQGGGLPVRFRAEAAASVVPARASARAEAVPARPALPEGRDEVRVVNPNDFSVNVILKSGGRERAFAVPAGGRASAYVPDGAYEVFFEYSNEPASLYQGDGFSLAGDGVQISIVKVSSGNYGIRKVR